MEFFFLFFIFGSRMLFSVKVFFLYFFISLFHFMGLQDVKQNDEILPFYDVLMPWNLIMEIMFFCVYFKDWSLNKPRYQSILLLLCNFDWFKFKLDHISIYTGIVWIMDTLFNIILKKLLFKYHNMSAQC